MDEQDLLADAGQPLKGFYPFNQPGQPILLYQGEIGGPADENAPGTIELALIGKPSVICRVESEWDRPFKTLQDSWSIEISDSLRAWRMSALSNGIINHGEFAIEDARVNRVTAHWINLPSLPAQQTLYEHHDGGWTRWSGRWKFQVQGWSVTVDRRLQIPDVGIEK